MRSREEIDQWFEKLRTLLRDAKREREDPNYQPPAPDPVDEALAEFMEDPLPASEERLLIEDDLGDLVLLAPMAFGGPFAVTFTLPELAELTQAVGGRVLARLQVGVADYEHMSAHRIRTWPDPELFFTPDRFVDEGAVWADLDSVSEGALVKLVELWEIGEQHRWHQAALEVLLRYIHGRLGTKALARESEA